jgi:hypothetical protein
VVSLPQDKPKIAFHAAMMAIQNFGFFKMYFDVWGSTQLLSARPPVIFFLFGQTGPAKRLHAEIGGNVVDQPHHERRGWLAPRDRVPRCGVLGQDQNGP